MRLCDWESGNKKKAASSSLVAPKSWSHSIVVSSCMGHSMNSLKRACRKLGIAKWPYRQVRTYLARHIPGLIRVSTVEVAGAEQKQDAAGLEATFTARLSPTRRMRRQHRGVKYGQHATAAKIWSDTTNTVSPQQHSSHKSYCGAAHRSGRARHTSR